MLDIGFRHLKSFAKNLAHDVNHNTKLSKGEIDKYFSKKVKSENIKNIEEYLCMTFAEYLADNDLVFSSVDFKTEKDRYISAYEYVDMYYRKALLKYFLNEKIKIIKEDE